MKWGELTEAQRQIATRLWAHLLELLPEPLTEHRDASENSLKSVLPPIQKRRHNRVFLLEGKRGSGKTAVLVSLLDSWNKAALGEGGDLLDLEGIEAGHIIPIGLLDLRSLPSQTSLQVHMAALLRDLIEYVGFEVPDSRRRRPTDPRGPDSENGRQAWRRFFKAVATTEVDMVERSVQLDPESFAEEVHSAEKDRFELQLLFRKLMDKIVQSEKFTKARDKLPLFVVAIDDVDMNPARVIECLEMIERFSHERLVYVLTGDDEIFDDSLRANFLAQFCKPFEGRSIPHSWPDENVSRRVTALARKYYDKVIPPGQCFKLEPLRGEERLGLFGLHAALETYAVGATNVAALMTEYPILSFALPDNLRELQDLEALLGGAAERSAFALIEALDAQTRRDTRRDTPLVSARPSLGGQPGKRLDVSWFGWEAELKAQPVKLGGELQWQVRWVSELRPCFQTQDKNGRPLRHMLMPSELFLLASVIADGPPQSDAFRHHAVRRSQMLDAPSAMIQSPNGLSWQLPDVGVWGLLAYARSWSEYIEHKLGLSQPRHNPEVNIEDLALAHVRALLDAVCRKSTNWTEQPDTWSGLAEHAKQMRSQMIVDRGSTSWFIDEFVLLLGTPESGLRARTREQLLEAWRSVGSDWEAAIQRTQKLREEALSLVNRPAVSQPAGDAGMDPWTQQVSGEIMQDLRGALELIPPSMKSGLSPWHPKNLTSYVTEQAWRGLADDPGLARRLRNVLAHHYTDLRGVLADFAPRVTWDGLKLSLHGSFGLNGTKWSVSEMSELPDWEFAYSMGQINGPADLLRESMVPFMIAHDLARDTQFDLRPEVGPWPLLRSFNASGTKEAMPWPVPSWEARLDLDLCQRAWVDILQRVTPSGQTLSSIARMFIHALSKIFATRELPKHFPKLSWPQVIAEARLALSGSEPNPKHPRVRAYQAWLDKLIDFAAPSAVLPMEDAAAVLVAVGGRKLGGIGRLSDMPAPPEHPWRRVAAARDDPDLWIIREQLREEYTPRDPELFELPAGQADAVARFAKILESRELSRYFTDDLRRLTGWADTQAIEAAAEQLEADGALEPALALAYAGASSARTTSKVTWSGRHLHTRGAPVIEPGVPEAPALPTEFADFNDFNVKFCRGALMFEESSPLAEVLHALAYDFVHERTPTKAPPQYWPLVRYKFQGQTASNWPMVQWPQRCDCHLQLQAWHSALALGDLNEQSLAMLARHYIAATVLIYQGHTIQLTYPGSWKDVFTQAHAAVPTNPAITRDHAYRAWVGMLARFSLPRVGLSPKHAADVLVRLWDLTDGTDPRPELLGRINSIGEGQPAPFDQIIAADHPALLVALADDEKLASVMDQLRDTYDLG